MTHPVILFVFAGRRPNLELQIPLISRILAENPDVSYHIWNFARNDSDREYIKTIDGQGITVWNGDGEEFASPIPTEDGAQVPQFGANQHNAAYQHYSQPKFEGCVFVKIDDDIVFLETARFRQFISAINAHPGSVVIADTINNCCCTPTHPILWERFLKLGIPVDQVFRSAEFADMAHNYLFDHTELILNQPLKLVPTGDWVEINAVGYTYQAMRHAVDTIGTPHPPWLSGRDMRPQLVKRRNRRRQSFWTEEWPWGQMFGDEGTFQLLPRLILKGFTAAHLSFGAQGEDRLDEWRAGYHRLGQTYLATAAPCGDVVPEPVTEMSCGKRNQGLWPEALPAP